MTFTTASRRPLPDRDPARMAFERVVWLALTELDTLDDSGAGGHRQVLSDGLGRWARGLRGRLRRREAEVARKLSGATTDADADAGIEPQISAAAVRAAETCLRRARIHTRRALRNKFWPLISTVDRLSLWQVMYHQVERALVDLAAAWGVTLVAPADQGDGQEIDALSIPTPAADPIGGESGKDMG